jgi:hypothetical protein
MNNVLEPLSVENDPPWYAGSTPIRSQDGKEIARVHQRKDFDATEVAKRIVACVNACAGIPTHALANADSMRVTFSDGEEVGTYETGSHLALSAPVLFDPTAEVPIPASRIAPEDSQ